jgi:tRNA splicing endonuclease
MGLVIKRGQGRNLVIFSLLITSMTSLYVLQEPTPDLEPETLSVISSLCLAQAQELVVQKAIRDKMKASEFMHFTIVGASVRHLDNLAT